MKLWIRRYTSVDLVLAETELEARNVDQSDAADSLQLQDCDLATKEWLERKHPSWLKVTPSNTEDFKSIGDLLGVGVNGTPSP